MSLRPLVFFLAAIALGCGSSDPTLPNGPDASSDAKPSETSDAPPDVDDGTTDGADASTDVPSESSPDVGPETAGPCPFVECSPGAYCEYPPGTCGGSGPGTCRKIATAADCAGAAKKEVCGCDGTTYANECLAAASATSIASTGPCASGTCGDGKCDPTLGEDCKTCGVDCGSCSSCGDGICDKFTEDCTKCSLDCGPCGPPPPPPWCDLATGCPSGHYCELGSTCGAGGEKGYCAVQPTSCPPPSPPTYVCGCDGVTYDTPCHAAAAGVSMAKKGPC